MLSLDYIAGFIDGEGCITISKQSRRNSTTPQGYQAYLTVANTHEAVVRLIEDWAIGEGAKTIVNVRKGTYSTRECWTLVIYGNSLKVIIPLIKDRLIVKKRQADIMMQYLSTMPGGNRPIGEEIREERKTLMEIIQLQNQGWL